MASTMSSAANSRTYWATSTLPVRNARCQLFHVLGAKAVGRLKPDLGATRLHETTIERKDMEVWV
jgi:hypothetical protein